MLFLLQIDLFTHVHRHRIAFIDWEIFVSKLLVGDSVITLEVVRSIAEMELMEVSSQASFLKVFLHNVVCVPIILGSVV